MAVKHKAEFGEWLARDAGLERNDAGAAVIAGTAVPVAALWSALEAGQPLRAFLREHATVSRAQAVRAIRAGRAALLHGFPPKDGCLDDADPRIGVMDAKESGSLIFTGTRLSPESLFDYLEAGDSIGQFVEQYATADEQQARLAVHAAAALLETLVPRTARKATDEGLAG